jgi:hypothetical protein
MGRAAQVEELGAVWAQELVRAAKKRLHHNVPAKETDGDQPAKSKRNRFRKTRRQDGGDQEIQP